MARARRGRGEGSVYEQRPGLWAASVSAGSVGGKRRRITVYAPTKAAALAKLRAASAEAGVAVDGEDISVAAYFSRWLKAAEGHLRPSTVERYRQIADNQVLPHLGALRLAKLTPKHVQGMVDALRAEPDASTSKVAGAHKVLHAALHQAVRWELVARNVADAIERPRTKATAVTTWTVDEVARFLEANREDRLYALYVLALTTGMREGELFGLQWGDIDLARGHIRVTHALMRDSTERVPLKTAQSQRRVELDAETVRVLKEHRKASDSEWLFTSPDGRPLRRSNFIRRQWREAMDRAGVCHIRFHDLRHTAASLLLRAGVHPKVVQERLGHANITLTLSLYSHLMPGVQREAMTSAMPGVWDDLRGTASTANRTANDAPTDANKRKRAQASDDVKPSKPASRKTRDTTF